MTPKNWFTTAMRQAFANAKADTIFSFSSELGVPNNSLSTWMKGTHHPRPSVLAQILQRIHITVDARRGMLEEFFHTKGLQRLGIVVVAPYETVPSDEVIWQAAKAFHTTYEALAPSYGEAPDGSVAWEDLSDSDRRLLLATLTTLALRGALIPSTPTPEEP